MVVVCERCGHRGQRVLYQPPGTPSKEVRLFLVLVVACAFVGMYNLTVVLFKAIPIVDKPDELGITGLDIPGSRLAVLRDFVQLYGNATRFFLSVMLIAMVLVPARILWAVVVSVRGGANALLPIRGTLIAQASVEFVATSALLALGFDLEVIKIPFHFGYNLLLAPLTLAVSFRPAVRDHFSAHRWERLPTGRPPA